MMSRVSTRRSTSKLLLAANALLVAALAIHPSNAYADDPEAIKEAFCKCKGGMESFGGGGGQCQTEWVFDKCRVTNTDNCGDPADYCNFDNPPEN